MNRPRRWLGKQSADPLLTSSWLAALMIVGAFVSFFLGWRGAAATLTLPLQVPYLVSGAVGGFCLLIAGGSILLIQGGRRRHRRELRKLGEVLLQARALLDAVEERSYRDDLNGKSSSARSSSRVRARPK